MFPKFTLNICFVLILIISISGADKPCMKKHYPNKMILCVCNATYCDEISKVKPLRKNHYLHVASTLEGLRFHKEFGKMEKSKPPPITINIFDTVMENDIRIKINRKTQFQTMNGFGGAFTDSAGFNIRKLSEDAQRLLMKSYFGEDGLEYNMARIPIGGTDFSTRPYTYNDYPEDDMILSNFSLSIEDFEYKIPYIKEAKELATEELHLIATSWSPPIWMKTSKAINGPTKLEKKYYQLWADYHIRFLDEYEKNGLTFWGITTGNEPGYGYLPWKIINCLGWFPETHAHWIAENFGPTVRNSKHSSIKILGLDENRLFFPWWIKWLNTNKKAISYLDGLAVHWYLNDFIPPTVLDDIHNILPDKFLISTEASSSDRIWHVQLSDHKSWSRGMTYVREIIEETNHWSTGWIDWNLALDVNGGPSWVNNFVDAGIIVRSKKKDFLKTPIYYAMGHFSKFIPRGSKRIEVLKINNDISNVAFLRPDGGITVVFYNPFPLEKSVMIEEEGRGYIQLNILPNSMNTVVYW